MKKLSFLLAVCLISGCATSVKINVTKPAEVNMAGARTIAIMDVNYSESGVIDLGKLFKQPLTTIFFGDSEKDRINNEVVKYTTSSLTMSLLNTGYFTVVSSKDLSGYFDESKEVSPVTIGIQSGAEAIIVGDITRMDYEDRTYYQTVSVYNSDDEEYEEREVQYIDREVEFSFSYRVIDTENGAIIASRSFTERREDSQPSHDKYYMKSEVNLFQECVDEIMGSIVKQLAPYMVTEYRYLLKDESKSEELKRAVKFVEGGLYQEAYEIFFNNWNNTMNPSAGYNAAIMNEALGRIQEATDLMKDVAVKTDNKDAMKEHQRLKVVLKEQEEVKRQLQD